MGAKNGIHLSDLYGKTYNDPLWEKLLDQLTFKDMDILIAKGGYGTPAIKSIGKIQLVDTDGPAALNNKLRQGRFHRFPLLHSLRLHLESQSCQAFRRHNCTNGQRYAHYRLVCSHNEHSSVRLWRP